MSEVPIKYDVDAGVPIPVRRKKRPPLDEMRIGDSIVFPTMLRSSVQSYASIMKRKTQKEFTIKKLSAEECRIWRIK